MKALYCANIAIWLLLGLGALAINSEVTPLSYALACLVIVVHTTVDLLREVAR